MEHINHTDYLHHLLSQKTELDTIIESIVLQRTMIESKITKTICLIQEENQQQHKQHKHLFLTLDNKRYNEDYFTLQNEKKHKVE